ncbi:hypothetical protein AVEN_24264-1 [Araneus ventricosus]|uniref:Uncharacterized protein n=1 Tax=Araneus ventricosus TaxID=182803 RepID=A0A4Y2LLD6_ARAVE|nr:hypothetical protein AVEN_24264-1 [Araneus ventricosus]
MSCGQDVEEVATETRQFSSRLIELCEVWYCRDGTKFLKSVGMDVFFKLHPEVAIHCCSRPFKGRNNSHCQQKAFLCVHPLPQEMHNTSLLF